MESVNLSFEHVSLLASNSPSTSSRSKTCVTRFQIPTVNCILLDFTALVWNCNYNPFSTLNIPLLVVFSEIDFVFFFLIQFDFFNMYIF